MGHPHEQCTNILNDCGRTYFPFQLLKLTSRFTKRLKTFLHVLYSKVQYWACMDWTFVQYISQTVGWIRIWRIWKPSQHLECQVVFLKAFKPFWLCERVLHPDERGHCHQEMVSVKACTCVATSLYLSEHSNECQNPNFPSRKLSKTWHCASVLRSIHRLSWSSSNKINTQSWPSTWCEREFDYQTRSPYSLALMSSCDAFARCS